MTKFQENETIELKKSTSELKEAVISIVAMLNKHQHGEVWFGIKNDGTISGQQVSDKTIRDVSKAIADHNDPRARACNRIRGNRDSAVCHNLQTEQLRADEA